MSVTDRSAILSCEFFPPRTEAGAEKLLTTQQTLNDTFQPAYYSVTFGAGGTTRDSTLEIVKLLAEKNINVAQLNDLELRQNLIQCGLIVGPITSKMKKKII